MAAARARTSAVSGRRSTKGVWFGVAKSKAVVRSLHTARRQGEMLGSITPKRRSRNRITEVWSATSEWTKPPRDQGDSTYMGTRGPRP